MTQEDRKGGRFDETVLVDLGSSLRIDLCRLGLDRFRAFRSSARITPERVEARISSVSGVREGGNARGTRISSVSGVREGGNARGARISSVSGVREGGNARGARISSVSGVREGGNARGARISVSSGVREGGNARGARISSVSGVRESGNARSRGEQVASLPLLDRPPAGLAALVRHKARPTITFGPSALRVVPRFGHLSVPTR